MKQPGWGVLAGALGAAATGVAVGVAAKQRAKIAADRRRLATQLSETSEAPRGEPCSVVADDGVRLSCEEIEADELAALTVVLVHGFALDRRTWHFQRPFLATLTDPRVRVVLYDQRSHGRSERAPRESCTIEQLGHDLDAVIRALAPEGPLVLIGHSMGGMTIMALAESLPGARQGAGGGRGVPGDVGGRGRQLRAVGHVALPAQPAHPRRRAARGVATVAGGGGAQGGERRRLGGHPQARLRRPRHLARARGPRRFHDQRQRGGRAHRLRRHDRQPRPARRPSRARHLRGAGGRGRRRPA